jgi:hypothetical protein
MDEYSHAFKNAVILDLFHYIMYTYKLLRFGNRLYFRPQAKGIIKCICSGGNIRKSWSQSKGQADVSAGQNMHLRPSLLIVYRPDLASGTYFGQVTGLQCVRSALSTGSPEKLHFPHLFIWGWKHLQRILVVIYRRFRTAYQPHFQGLRWPMTREYGTDGLSWKCGKQLPPYSTLQSRRAKNSSTPRRTPEFSFLLLTANLVRLHTGCW